MSSNHPAPPPDAPLGGTAQPDTSWQCPVCKRWQSTAWDRCRSGYDTGIGCPGRLTAPGLEKFYDEATGQPLFRQKREQQPPPPAAGTPARTLAEELHQLAMNTPMDPAKLPRDETAWDAVQRTSYIYGHRDASHAIAKVLLGHPALRQPAPVAADGAGQYAATERSCDDIRAAGWCVAVHNDYRQDGDMYTFWLFTKGTEFVKGEGFSDGMALTQIRTALGLPRPSSVVSVLTDDAAPAGAGETIVLGLVDHVNDLSARLAAAEAARAAASDERDGLKVWLECIDNVLLKCDRGQGRENWPGALQRIAEIVDEYVNRRAALAAPAGGAAGRDGKA